MWPLRKKHPLAALALVVVLGLLGSGGYLLWERFAPQDDERLKAMLTRELQSDAPFRWERLLRAAVKVGEVVGMDLPRLVRLSKVLPQDLLVHYYEGAAHGIPWPYEDMKACATAIDQSIPEPYRQYIYYGPIQLMTRQLGGDPKEVLPRLKDLPQQMRSHIKNGLRIGLLLHYNEELEQAVKVILQYPAVYHEDMFEEHGWWMGQNFGDDVERVESIIDLVPQKYKPESYHGYIRGLDPSDDPDLEQRVISRINPRFKKICLAALKEKYHGPPGEDKQEGKRE